VESAPLTVQGHYISGEGLARQVKDPCGRAKRADLGHHAISGTAHHDMQ
jgi:hypothetical protein